MKNYLFLLILFTVVSPSCDQVIDSPVPYVHVQFPINLSITNELTFPNNSVYFSGVGYSGVIVYYDPSGVYYAFDATCTEEVRRNCIVKNDGILAECPCCGSQYLLDSGYPASPPATMPLRQYQVTVVNAFELLVHN